MEAPTRRRVSVKFRNGSSVPQEGLSRRDVLVGAAAASAATLLPGSLFAAEASNKTFTILHTNDMHSAFVGMGPAADYTPFKLNDDTTRGGYARLGALIAQRRQVRQAQGDRAEATKLFARAAEAKKALEAKQAMKLGAPRPSQTMGPATRNVGGGKK